MRGLRWAALPLAILVLGACGDDDDAGGSGGEDQAQACQPASKALVAAIGEGLTVQGGGGLRRAYVVRSDDFEKVYMVAGDLQGAGLEGDTDIGVWATNSPKGAGLIMAVDSVAQEFSQWPPADQTDAAIEQSAQGVDEARACAEG